MSRSRQLRLGTARLAPLMTRQLAFFPTCFDIRNRQLHQRPHDTSCTLCRPLPLCKRVNSDMVAKTTTTTKRGAGVKPKAAPKKAAVKGELQKAKATVKSAVTKAKTALTPKKTTAKKTTAPKKTTPLTAKVKAALPAKKNVRKV
uniref:Uncharacterized protein n=1 Tax=Auxenochlorella protothecoides TaxID=3075 RepID=A0A1D1ZZG9_AUXPR